MLPTTVEGIDDAETVVYMDEVGRGCLAFSVAVAAVIWPKDFVPQTPEDQKHLDAIKDSKKLSPKKREVLAAFIKENAQAYAIHSIDNEEIDRINILQATFKAMHGALDEIPVKFDRTVVDGDKFKPYMTPTGDFVPHTCVVGGDNLVFQIACASILAKVHRDTLITELGESDETLKCYMWHKNKGYGTKDHIAAIKEHGMSRYHRRSFIHFV